MATHYLRINYNLGSGITDDRRLKVSGDDANAAFLDEKITVSSKLIKSVTNPGTNELLNFDVDESNINHDNLAGFVLNEHRAMDDLSTTTTSLWSSQKITDYVADQIATKDEASEIAYDNTDSGLTATNVKAALDEIDATLDSTVATLNDHLNNNGSVRHAASEISYAGSPGITATTVEGAIDELDSEKFNTSDFSSTFDSNLASKSTSDISEGTNLYFTQERSQDATAALIQNSSEIEWTYDDVANTLVADFTVSNLTAAPSIALTDEFLIQLSSNGELRSATLEKVLELSGNVSDGDIKETQANLADNQTTAANITGLSFSNSVVRSFEAIIAIERGAENETVELCGIQDSTGWNISEEKTGDITGVTFSITSTGQVQYTSTSTGTAPKVIFRADTVSKAV